MGMIKNYNFFTHVNKNLLHSMIYWLYIMQKWHYPIGPFLID